ncbi:hypothetical protein [Blastococcus sp. PRF04-17]|uniref:hypothetical protein n=1 Tax=Blastococcus sp. PRF04-17 TaxID=2933797 RepID=UPI001FF3FE6A|nr:hypothetical protein [Blastococcus sp. PRF04-17]UOY04115.1 hypothetical protein MVA48_11020 [Blastococcus sp. PRF04-17]
MPGEDDAGRPVQIGPGQHGVAHAFDLEAAETAEGGLDRVGQGALVARHRRGVDQGTGEREDVGGQVERRQVTHGSRAYGGTGPTGPTRHGAGR